MTDTGAPGAASREPEIHDAPDAAGREPVLGAGAGGSADHRFPVAEPGELADEPADELVRRALALRAGGDLAGAIALLEPARAAADPPAVALEALGALYLEADRPADALAVLEPLAAGPDADPVVRFNAARAALALGRDEDAERYLRAAVAAAPVSRAALLLWELLDGAGRHREAAEALLPLGAGPAAAALEESDPELAAEVALQLARSLIAAGDHAAAVAPLERRTRLRPGEAEPWRLLGETLLETGRLDEARTALARTQEIAEAERRAALEERARERAEGTGFDDWMRRAGERRAAGDLEGALGALAEAIALAPRDPRPRMLEVRLLVTLGRAADALPRAEELVGIAAAAPEALYLRGMTRLAAGDPAGAEPDLRRVLEHAPGHVPAINGLATALLRRGAPDDLDEAERLSRRALELSPSDPVAARNLAEIQQRRAPH